jgi:trimethylamine:corrinoid methyltransferase-like protein
MAGGSMVLYPEKVILDHEICQDAHDLLHGFDFDSADMALDVIREVGPRSHFLRQKHTRQHIRDFRLSRLLRQKGPNGTERNPVEVAFEEFKRIEATHHPKPLSADVVSELDRILAAADRETARAQ